MIPNGPRPAKCRMGEAADGGGGGGPLSSLGSGNAGLANGIGGGSRLVRVGEDVIVGADSM